MKYLRSLLLATSVLAVPHVALAEGKVVPEIDFLTWPSTKYQHYFETTRYLADSWEELGIKVKLNPQPFPAPMLGMWFNEHKFDVVLSVLSGSSARFEPEFYSNGQFNSANSTPGNMNVGSFSSAKIDELGDKQLRIYDAEERRKVIYDLQAAIYEEQPEALIAYVINTTAYNKTTTELEDYIDTPEGLRSIWNLSRLKPIGGQPAVRLGWTIDQESWNPLTFKIGEDLDRLGLVYDRLMLVGPDGSPQLSAASALDVIDETTLDVSLRDDLKFSDGEPVTIEDVVFTFNYLKENNAIYFKQYLDNVESIAVVDGKARFKLVKPSAPFVATLLAQAPILPEHVWSGILEETGLEKPQDYKNVPLVGSGPYRLKYWKEGREISMERNPEHFMKPAADLLFIQFGSAEVLSSALTKGDIDVTLQPLVPTVVEEFRTFADLQIIQAQSNGYMSARYNINNEFFANKAVRQALSHATPYESIIEEVLGGDAAPTASSIVPSNTFWHNPELKLPEYDLEKAREILKSAGFTWGQDGRLRFPE